MFRTRDLSGRRHQVSRRTTAPTMPYRECRHLAWEYPQVKTDIETAVHSEKNISARIFPAGISDRIAGQDRCRVTLTRVARTDRTCLDLVLFQPRRAPFSI